jgi:glycosyltransferase involved in cell wall biosynthesis
MHAEKGNFRLRETIVSHACGHSEGSERSPYHVSVIVPALNEERNLPYVLSRIPDDVYEVILVDGRSTDRTVETARELLPSIKVVHQTRRGKGNALACGFAASSGDIVVMIDADCSTDPAEIPLFVDALLNGADFAKGSRFRKGGYSHDITRFRRLGNYFLNATVNVLFKTCFTDLCYGYNAFWRDALKAMDLPDVNAPAPANGERLWGDGFEVETLINVRVATRGLRITEVPSVEAARLHGVSNLNAFGDGTRVLRTIITEHRRHRAIMKQAASNATTTQFPKVHVPADEGPWESRDAEAAMLAGSARMSPVPANASE